MNFYHLTIELIIDILAIILGFTLIIRRTDNLPKFYWGIIAAGIGIMFAWENIGWLFIRNTDPAYEYEDILNIEKMLKWYVLAGPVSLYPLASLRPGYLNRFRILIFMIPSIIITTVGICFLYFDGNLTPIDSISQIPQSIHHLDIKLRLIIFVFSVVTPFLYFTCPLVNNKTDREITSMMYMFIGFLFLLLGIYISFTLFINNFLFNGFGMVSIIFSILFSVLYLRSENPFSKYAPTESTEETTPDINVSPLYSEIENYLKNSCAFINPEYKIECLAKHFEEKESVVSAAIKSGGHTGFREYINYLRLEHFKSEAAQNPHKTVKELMYACGFTSRPTFYRIFSEQYDITPMEFIKNQAKKTQP